MSLASRRSRIWLLLLAKELDVPVVVSQLNRCPEQRVDKKPIVAGHSRYCLRSCLSGEAVRSRWLCRTAGGGQCGGNRPGGFETAGLRRARRRSCRRPPGPPCRRSGSGVNAAPTA
ncbi:hypothetical protein ACFVTY_03320 [Streptomyces sp. NPDC058067]|uniref:hypothetical protein n=1 Tax=Streptomyces sp. NPDC058067 TaxID=3346324 RepID=UPI0036E62345